MAERTEENAKLLESATVRVELLAAAGEHIRVLWYADTAKPRLAEAMKMKSEDDDKKFEIVYQEKKAPKKKAPKKGAPNEDSEGYASVMGALNAITEPRNQESEDAQFILDISFDAELRYHLEDINVYAKLIWKKFYNLNYDKHERVQSDKLRKNRLLEYVLDIAAEDLRKVMERWLKKIAWAHTADDRAWLRAQPQKAIQGKILTALSCIAYEPTTKKPFRLSEFGAEVYPAIVGYGGDHNGILQVMEQKLNARLGATVDEMFNKGE